MEQSRRRVVARIVLLLVWAYGNAGAIYALSVMFSDSVTWQNASPGVKVLSVLFGGGILILEAFWLILFVRDLFRGEGTQYLLSRSSHGTARISLRAIQASLMRRARDLEEVIGARITVRRPAEKRLRVDVAYTTTEDRNAILVSESLRRALRERFEEIVQPVEGFEVEFDVKIDGFVPGAPVAPEPQEEEPEEREPFTGPRYPVD
ncbi:MAG: hypothetical protein ABFS86_11260 [Planctomycetota bacterium]